MSKAILVIDMPSNCVECPLLDRNRILEICSITGNEIDNITYEGKEELEKNEDCPLKPLPKYKKLEENDIYNTNDMWQKIGWNNCLRNIIGEE